MISMIEKSFAISTLLSNSIFHLPSLDSFECGENHNMDSNHFVTWIDRTFSVIQKELSKMTQSVHRPQSMHPFLGKDVRVSLILDNAT